MWKLCDALARQLEVGLLFYDVDVFSIFLSQIFLNPHPKLQERERNLADANKQCDDYAAAARAEADLYPNQKSVFNLNLPLPLSCSLAPIQI